MKPDNLFSGAFPRAGKHFMRLIQWKTVILGRLFDMLLRYPDDVVQ